MDNTESGISIETNPVQVFSEAHTQFGDNNWRNNRQRSSNLLDNNSIVKDSLIDPIVLFRDLEKLLMKDAKEWQDLILLDNYILHDIIPRGLRIFKFPAFNLDEVEFQLEWEQILHTCSKALIKLLIKYREYKLKSLKLEIDTLVTKIQPFEHIQKWKELNKNIQQRTMGYQNQTTITEFILIGFKNLHKLRSFLFIFFLIIYIIILTGNLFIIILVPSTGHLHSPMYFFLSSLSISDVLVTSNIVPNMLKLLWTEEGTISISNCILQFYVFGSLTAVECLLLTVMSYDRYLAICFPLQYSTIMNHQLCRFLNISTWLIGFAPTLPVSICLSRMQFCDLNVIDHFFCDLAPFLELACSDTSTVKMLSLMLSFLVTFFPFLFIIMSYSYIIRTILGIRTVKGRKKAFSTCSSHLAIVSIYYGSLIILYVIPRKKHSSDLNKFVSLLYTIVTPLLNPVIYSLKNKEISRAAQKLFKGHNKMK
ncbi:olfactory receptor 11A1-like [Bombina bombina]|uniref:olfactory receptor 11A1-like n=1 Tax=Bombina bombina TaxID=8345 RepID=UPI00235AE0EE|nr:olfactory receptor 11A1-like [Bombina bombina]